MHRFLLFLVIFLLFPAVAGAEESPSIQQLIEEAEAGDTIQLESGIYEGDVIIDKPVTIIGSGETIIQGTGTDNVILITADGVTVKNVTVQQSGTNLARDLAGIKIRSKDNRVEKVTIKESLHGIYLESSTGNQLVDNTIFGHRELNISRRGNGIHLFESNNNEILGNRIDGARDGMYISFSDENRIDKNTITNTRYGIHYMYSDYNSISENTLFENIGGAAIMYSNHITVKENVIYDHHGLQSFGILFQTADDVIAEENQIFFNTKGIFMDQSNRNIVRNNYIVNNQIGFDIWNSAMYNEFSGNQILDNNLQYTTNNGIDSNRWNDDKQGNAWSDYTFIDLDGDGAGDKPYTYQSAFGEVMSENQLGILFLYSPAIDLYEKWNQLFLADKGGITDEIPIQVPRQDGLTIPFISLAIAILLLVWFLQKVYGRRKC